MTWELTSLGRLLTERLGDDDTDCAQCGDYLTDDNQGCDHKGICYGCLPGRGINNCKTCEAEMVE